MNTSLIPVLVYLVGYLLGAVPFAVMVARAAGVDILKTGSGNPGATNVLRTLGRGPGYLVFLLDFLKGFAAAFWPMLLPMEGGWAPWLPILGLAGAITGHSFSVFLRFRGGKGVATAVGGLLAMQPWVILAAVLVWLTVFYTTRYVSLASIALGLSLPVSAWFFQGFYGDFLFALLLAALILTRHQANIQRLLKGEENRFERKRR